MGIVKGPRVWVLLGTGLLCLLCATMVSSDGARGDGNPVVWGNTAIESNTTLADGTWVVNGSLRVTNGTLVLENATLVFNRTTGSGLYVGQNGSIVSRSSDITGGGLHYVSFLGPATFIDGHLGNTTQRTSVWIQNTVVFMDRCVVDNWVIDVEGDLSAHNCTFYSEVSSIVGGDERRASKLEYRIVLENSTFVGKRGDVFSIILMGPGLNDINCTAVVRNCTFDRVGSGIRLDWFQRYGSVLLEDVDLDVTRVGISMERAGIRVHLTRGSIDGGQGLDLINPIFPGPRIHSVTINTSGPGVVGYNSPFNVTLHDLSITTETIGLDCYNFWVLLVNSSIDSEDLDVRLRYRTRVFLLDCEHDFAVSRSEHDQLIAMRTVDITRVRWDRGSDITEGRTDVFTVNHTYTGSVDNSAPGPIPLMYWRFNETILERSEKVFAIFNTEGEDFLSPLYPMMNVTSLVFEVVDHHPPEVVITSPRPGSVFNTTTLEVLGTCTDVGSGVEFVRARCDNGPWSDATLKKDGRFNVTVTVLSEGNHVIEVTARDHGRNVDDAWLGGVVTDTTPPFIEVDSPGHWTNQSEVLLLVRTEKLSTAFINDIPVDVDVEGIVAHRETLSEGITNFIIRVVDRAGNVNQTSYGIEMDTVPPMLLVDYPEQGGWINRSLFEVLGATEEHAVVLIDHEPAERRGVAFSTTIEASDGLMSLRIEAWDQAGNHAWTVLSFTVDTRPPDLTILTPNVEEETSVSELTVSGLASAAHRPRKDRYRVHHLHRSGEFRGEKSRRGGSGWCAGA